MAATNQIARHPRPHAVSSIIQIREWVQLRYCRTSRCPELFFLLSIRSETDARKVSEHVIQDEKPPVLRIWCMWEERQHKKLHPQTHAELQTTHKIDDQLHECGVCKTQFCDERQVMLSRIRRSRPSSSITIIIRSVMFAKKSTIPCQVWRNICFTIVTNVPIELQHVQTQQAMPFGSMESR